MATLKLFAILIVSELICESLIWDIRRRLAQRAIPTITTLVSAVSLSNGGGPYVELFLINAFRMDD